MMSEYLSKLASMPSFWRKATGSENLFKAGYDYKVGTTCRACDQDCSVARELKQQDVIVHCRTIASSNQVIKTTTKRDKLSAELRSLLCLEIEVVGLINSFPYLVIRGICDYADSQKNKQCQMHAPSWPSKSKKSLIMLLDFEC